MLKKFILPLLVLSGSVAPSVASATDVVCIREYGTGRLICSEVPDWTGGGGTAAVPVDEQR